MDIIFFLIAGAALCYGAFCLFDFLSWRFKSDVAMAKITGFQDRSFLGARLPIITFETEDGATINAEAQRIDRVLYLLNRPPEGSFIVISYDTSNPQNVRVAGYVKLILAGVLSVPMVAAVGMLVGKAILATKAVFLLMMICILLGGWVGLKFIQRNY
jgi:hypothetical protein